MNERAAQVAPFYAVLLNRIANERERRGLPVIHMEVGQPSAGAPAAAIAAGQRALVESPQGYWESGALAERIALHYRSRHGLVIEPSRVLLTMGASAALVLAIAVLFPRAARVAVPRPGYPAHRNVLHALALEPLELDCGIATRFQPTAAMIAALDPAPAGLILTSPSNPTGTMLADAELRALAAVCRARGIRIISDETYHGITYGARAHSILEYDADALVVNTFSKYWCMTGWRLGWTVVPPSLVDVMRRFAGNLFLVPPTLAQHVALAAMDETAELERHVATYAVNRGLLMDALAGFGVTRIAPADGAFYLYADVGHLTRDSLQWCRDLLDATGVALNTGRDFDSVHGDRYIRISFAVSTAETLQAIEALGGWLKARRRA
ncbi:MAG: aminotransferase class I/II-fold pyridoxal phosphate-dependent enzyme [Steroidobacteraceae bacterium]